MTIYVNLFILSIVQLLAASLRIFFLFPLTSTAKRKKDLAQDQNIPTTIFEVFKNQNMTLSSVSILNGIVFFCNRIFEKNYITQPRVQNLCLPSITKSNLNKKKKTLQNLNWIVTKFHKAISYSSVLSNSCYHVTLNMVAS